MRPIIVPVLFSLLLAACGSLVGLGGDRTASAIYRLGTDDSIITADSSAVGVLIGLDEPAASEALRKQGIAVSMDNGEIRYLAQADWADRVPRLVARYLGSHVSDVQGLTLLARPGSDIPLDYRLKIDLHDFSIHPAGNGGDVVVSLTALLVGLSPSEVIARQGFTRQVRISTIAPSPAASAFESALSGIAEDLQGWLRDHAAVQRVSRGNSPN